MTPDNIPFDDFYPFIATHVPGAPELLMEHSLRQAAIEFCRASEYWQEKAQPLQIITNVREYELEAAEAHDAGVIRPLTVAIEHLNLKPVEEAALSRMRPSWRDDVGHPQRYVTYHPSLIVLDRAPALPLNQKTLYCTLALKPSQDAQTLPRWLYEDFAEPVAAGAIWRLMATPGKEYSAPEMAGAYRQMFNQAVDRARARRVLAEGRGSQKIVGRRWA